MGDRFEWTQKCSKCGADIEVWYAESCGVTTVTCRKCLTLFNIVMDFRLVESGDERAEPEKVAPTTEERRNELYQHFLHMIERHHGEAPCGPCDDIVTLILDLIKPVKE